MIRRFLYNFFRGRNGFDALGGFSCALAFAFMLLALIPGVTGLIFYILALAAIFYMWFRMLSRNIWRRQEENRKFLDKTAGIRGYFRTAKMKFSQRKEYKFFKCPTCHSLLRVPRGKGKIQITCRKCGNRFSGKT